MVMFSRLVSLTQQLERNEKILGEYTRKEIIDQRKILKEIRNHAQELRLKLSAEKTRRYKSQLRTDARNLRKDAARQRQIDARKKATLPTNNPYFK